MSKIVILLFVVLVATVQIDGSFGTKRDKKSNVIDESEAFRRLPSVQNRVRLYFETEIDKFENEYNTANLTMTEKSRKLLEGAESTNRQVAERKRNIWKKAKREISELIVKTLGVHGTQQCYNMYTNIDLGGEVLLSKVNKCTKDILNTAFENVTETKVMYERLHETLMDWRSRFGACRHFYVTTSKQFKRAILCYEAVETQTERWLAKSGPQVHTKIDATNNLLSTLLTSIDNCANQYYDYELKVPDMIRRATLCYNRMMKDADYLVNTA